MTLFVVEMKIFTYPGYLFCYNFSLFLIYFYWMTVVGLSESTYTISATTSSNLPKLVDGVPSAGYVGAFEWVYYAFNNAYGGNRDVHVSLASTVGNADLYITLGEEFTGFKCKTKSSLYMI